MWIYLFFVILFINFIENDKPANISILTINDKDIIINSTFVLVR